MLCAVSANLIASTTLTVRGSSAQASHTTHMSQRLLLAGKPVRDKHKGRLLFWEADWSIWTCEYVCLA